MALAKKFQKGGGGKPPSEPPPPPDEKDTPSVTSEEPTTEPKLEPPKVKKALPVAKAPTNTLSAIRNLVFKVTGEKPLSENKGPIPAAPSGSTCIDDLIG